MVSARNGTHTQKDARSRSHRLTSFSQPPSSSLVSPEFNVGTALQFGSAEIDKKSFKGQDLRRSNFTAASCRSCNFAQTKLNGARAEREREKTRTAGERVGFLLLSLSHLTPPSRPHSPQAPT